MASPRMNWRCPARTINTTGRVIMAAYSNSIGTSSKKPIV
jgi:hypothetical protein